jgi:ABC-type Fe3+ transport system permease subunit
MNTLLAQVVITQSSPPVAGRLALLAVGAAALLVLLLLGYKAVHRRNERDHAERMRMLEMGFPLPPQDRSAWPKAMVCVAIGAGVPLVAFAFTLFAYSSRPDAADELWVAPGVVSGLSVIGTTLLAAHLFSRRTSSVAAHESEAEAQLRRGKTAMDPDAFDVAGRRG